MFDAFVGQDSAQRLEMATAGSGQGGQRVGKNAANEGPVKCRYKGE